MIVSDPTELVQPGGNNLDGALHLFLAGKPVIFFQIQKQVVHEMCIRDSFYEYRHVSYSGIGIADGMR